MYFYGCDGAGFTPETLRPTVVENTEIRRMKRGASFYPDERGN